MAPGPKIDLVISDQEMMCCRDKNLSKSVNLIEGLIISAENSLPN